MLYRPLVWVTNKLWLQSNLNLLHSAAALNYAVRRRATQGDRARQPLQPVSTGTRLFGLADSVWAVSVWAVSVTGLFGHGRSGLETFRSGYEILQKFYMFTF